MSGEGVHDMFGDAEEGPAPLKFRSNGFGVLSKGDKEFELTCTVASVELAELSEGSGVFMAAASPRSPEQTVLGVLSPSDEPSAARLRSPGRGSPGTTSVSRDASLSVGSVPRKLEGKFLMEGGGP